MRTGYCFKLSRVLRHALMSRACGSSLLWAIGALVLLSTLGAMVALLSPAALQSKLEQEAGMRAFYNANAGLNYILGRQEAARLDGVNLASFIYSMGGTCTVAFNLGQNDYFSYRIDNVKYNGNNGSYQIAELIGTVKNADGDDAYGYVFYGGGKGGSATRSYTIGGGGQTGPAWSKNVLSNYSGELKVSQNAIIGNDTSIYGKNGVTLDQGVTFNDNINIVGDGNVKISQKVKFNKLDNTICADGALTFDQDVVYSGSITATSDIKFSQNNEITGNVYSVKGGITCDQKVKINGDMHSSNDIKFSQNSSVNGDIYTLGNVTCDQGVKINGTIYKSSQKTVSASCSAKTGLLPSGYVVDNKCNYDVASPVLTANLPKTLTGSSPAVSPLKPDVYGSIKYDQNASRIKLSQGNYYINSLQFDQNGSMCLDLSSGGKINIYISNSMKLSQNFEVYVIVPGGTECLSLIVPCDKNEDCLTKINDKIDPKLSAKVYLETADSFALDQNGQWFGSILANNGIKFSQNSQLIGSYASIHGPVTVDQNFIVTYIQSGYSGSPN